MQGRDPKSALLRAAVYTFLFWMAAALLGWTLTNLAGYFFGATASTLAAAWFANFLALRIWEPRPFLDLGLRWSTRSATNLALGMAGGIGTALLVLAVPLVVRVARLESSPSVSFGTVLWVVSLLLVGSAGEELLFRGFGFQVLLRTFGNYTIILPVAVLFAVLHGANPNSTALGLANTAGFGVLFGYAFLRSRDLWLPIGLHFGWNLALTLFGVNVSGFTIKLTGYTLAWSAGPLWSGGDYGPEGSILTSAALVALFLFLWRAPVRAQSAPMLDAEEDG